MVTLHLGFPNQQQEQSASIPILLISGKVQSGQKKEQSFCKIRP